MPRSALAGRGLHMYMNDCRRGSAGSDHDKKCSRSCYRINRDVPDTCCNVTQFGILRFRGNNRKISGDQPAATRRHASCRIEPVLLIVPEHVDLRNFGSLG